MITIHFSPIESLPNAVIEPKGLVSKAFLSRDISSFHHAAHYVHRVPYGPNSSSDDSMILFHDGFGTCLTKHGLVARLAQELQLNVHRCEGFYPLTDLIVTGVGSILAEYGLPYIPRTHCFLSYNSTHVDLTSGNCTGKNGLIETYLKVIRVAPDQTQSERDALYRSYYTEICAVDPTFARIGVEGLFEVLKRCQSRNFETCRTK